MSVKILLVGAGSRGSAYAKHAIIQEDAAEIIGVAEPREYFRNRAMETYNIPPENCVTCWTELVEKNIKADAVIIATQDAMHLGPAVAFANKGYNILLEKPMAPDEKSCREIVDTIIRNKVIFSVCHVLRYTNYTQKLKAIIDSGTIGEVINIQQFEPVGYWHQAHSYVRGNWRKEAESAPMLLAKSCHDLDWIRYIMGCRCEKISSFGSLYYFKKEHKPKGAGERCMDCSIENECAYSAKRFYFASIGPDGDPFWAGLIAAPPTHENVTEALRTGPYGRCVWACDNDVVDNQVVNMSFEGGKTASFTMTAFCEGVHRKTRIFGTKGRIESDGSLINIFDFLSNQTEVIDTHATSGDITGGHGGGDEMIMKNFIGAIAHNDPSRILSGPEETLESHLMVFAAEKARHADTVEKIIN
jgi:predicted dehydrogenase